MYIYIQMQQNYWCSQFWNPSQFWHDVACFTNHSKYSVNDTNDKRHTCMQAHKNRSSHLHPCTLHLIIWNVYQGEKPDKNFRPLNSNQHTSHDTIVCSIEGREGGKKGREKSLIRIYRMPSWFPPGLAICKSSFQCAF